MAIYHLSAKIVSRSTGRSSVAAAAYRSASRLYDQRTGQNHDFRRKGGVEHSEIVAPPRTPDWMLDRSKLWNAVERAEIRKDAQLAREIEVSLPRELAGERRAGLVRDFVQAEFVSQGMIVDFAIHVELARDGGEQPHAHIMLATRAITSEGFGPKNRAWNSTAKLEGWRSRWAEHVNLELECAGHEARVDHRTLDAQRAEAEREAERARGAGDVRRAEQQEERAAALDREAEPKLGPIANNMEKLGHASRLGDKRREVEARNLERRTMREQARELAKQITEAARQVAEEARRRLQDLAQRIETAYRVVRERADAFTRPAMPERERAPAAPPNPAALLASATRDVMLGRTRPAALEPAREVSRDALLGRASGEGREKSATDVAALLGRITRSQSKSEARLHDDEDRGR